MVKNGKIIAMKRIHVFITGKAQGVLFRAHMQQTARSLGFTGWVRNLPDGRVEALLEGEEKNLPALRDWVGQGPPRAVVQDVAWTEEPYRGEYTDFTVRY